MKFSCVGGVEYYDASTLYWVSISDLPPEIQSKAQEIDGEAYDPGSFEMCVIFDLNTGKFRYETDGGERNIYYVDDDGNKCWFQADFSEGFLNEVYSVCEKTTAGKMALDGYAVTDCVRFDNGHGYIFAEKSGAERPFAVVHIGVDRNGRWRYHAERTFTDAEAAKSKFSERVKDYQQYHSIVKPSLAEQLQMAKRDATQQGAVSSQAVNDRKPPGRGGDERG